MPQSITQLPITRFARSDTLRPNQILAVGGLPLSAIAGTRARRIVDAVEEHLLTPLGLRSLAPCEPGYIGVYSGDSRARDAAYHQGTVWPWLMGPFIEAWVHVRGTRLTRATRRACGFSIPSVPGAEMGCVH